MSETGRLVRVVAGALAFVGVMQSALANEKDDPFAELMKGVQLAPPGEEPKVVPGRVMPENDDKDNPFLKITGPVRRAETKEEIIANLRSCMQRAVVKLDDKASDVGFITYRVIGNCQREGLAFLDIGGDHQDQIMRNTAADLILENRAPKWWQFWK